MGRYALKHDGEFLVADAHGDVTGEGDGLYSNDTRLLSRMCLTVGGATPLAPEFGREPGQRVLSGESERPAAARARRAGDAGRRDPRRADVLPVRPPPLRTCSRSPTTRNAQSKATLRLAFAADFADIFEVRGYTRARRGRMLPPALDDAAVTLAYEGLDGVVRSCVIAFSQRPDRLAQDAAEFALSLPRHAQRCLYLEIGAERAAAPGRAALPECGGAGAVGDAPEAPPGRDGPVRARAVSDLAREVARGPRAAHHRAAERALPVRRHPVVLDTVRSRRDRHGVAGALARCDARARRAAVPRRSSGARDVRVRRRGSRQDPPRNPRRASSPRSARCRSATTTAASTRRRCS